MITCEKQQNNKHKTKLLKKQTITPPWDNNSCNEKPKQTQIQKQPKQLKTNTSNKQYVKHKKHIRTNTQRNNATNTNTHTNKGQQTSPEHGKNTYKNKTKRE